MNTKDLLRLVRFRPTSARQSVPLGQATRLPPSFHFGATSATDFISKFILGGGDKSRLHEEVAASVAPDDRQLQLDSNFNLWWKGQPPVFSRPRFLRDDKIGRRCSSARATY